MLGLLLVASTAAALALSSLAAAAALGVSGPLARLLAVYLIACAQVCVWALALSPFNHLDRWGIAVAASVSAAAASAVWFGSSRPRLLGVRPQLASLRRELRDPVLGIPVAVVAAAYGYLVAVGIVLPQNDGDPLVYQLTRAALWRQQGAVGLVGDGVDTRLDGNPIVAESGQAIWLILGHSERWVWIGQLSAALALAAATVLLARRLGNAVGPALLSGIVVASLPVVLLQAPTAFNDLVVASFLGAAALFVVRGTRVDLALAGLATALAVGTKFSGPLLLPLLGLVAGAAAPRRRWPAALAALGLGATLGSGWYVANLVRTGDATGGIQDAVAQAPVRTPPGFVLRVEQFTLDAIELPGLDGIWVGGYGLAGVAVLGAAITWRRGRSPGLLLAGVGLLALPLVVAAAYAVLHGTFAHLWRAAGYPGEANTLNGSHLRRSANGVTAWFGPLFAPVALVALGVGLRRRRTLPRGGLVVACAAAPVVGILVLAEAIVYDPTRGRFLLAAAALNIATWGLVTRVRGVAVLVAAAAVVGTVLSLANWLGKPPGLGSKPGGWDGSVWTAPRWQAQTMLRRFTPDEQDERVTIRILDDTVPPAASVALRLRANDFRFPAFGERLSRHVSLLGPGDDVPRQARWAVVAPGLNAPRCRGAWSVAWRGETGWRVLRRTMDDAVCDM